MYYGLEMLNFKKPSRVYKTEFCWEQGNRSKHFFCAPHDLKIFASPLMIATTIVDDFRREKKWNIGARQMKTLKIF